MKLPEERDPQYKEKEPPFSYARYCFLGWVFVFVIYIVLFFLGMIFVPRFFWRLPKMLMMVSIWEVLGVLIFLRWHLPLAPSGGLLTLYELLFPWKYPISDEERKWLG